MPFLRAQHHGHIVNVSSISGLAPRPGSGIYGATKFALEGLSESLAQEVAPLGIRVTLVEPGAFRTDFLSAHSSRKASGSIQAYAETNRKIDNLLEIDGRQPGDPHWLPKPSLRRSRPKSRLCIWFLARTPLNELGPRFNACAREWTRGS